MFYEQTGVRTVRTVQSQISITLSNVYLGLKSGKALFERLRKKGRTLRHNLHMFLHTLSLKSKTKMKFYTKLWSQILKKKLLKRGL